MAQTDVETHKRPGLVWVISIFYVIAFGWSLLSVILIYTGIIPTNQAQQAYFDSIGTGGILFSIFITILNMTAAVMLFLMKRHAFYFFLGGFFLSVMITVRDIISNNLIEAMGVLGLIPIFISWAFIIAIILYTRKLIKRGVLK